MLFSRLEPQRGHGGAVEHRCNSPTVPPVRPRGATWLAWACWNHGHDAATAPSHAARRGDATQRLIHLVTSYPVDDSLVLHLLELAMKAPTGSNAQNWEFIVVKDREVVAKLGRLNRGALKTGGAIYKRILGSRMNDQMLRIEKAVQWQADHFDEIPVVVVACLKGVIPLWPS